MEPQAIFWNYPKREKSETTLRTSEEPTLLGLIVRQIPRYPCFPHPGGTMEERPLEPAIEKAKELEKHPVAQRRRPQGSCAQAREPRCDGEAQKRMWVELSPNWHLEKQPQNLSWEGAIV